MPTSEDFARAIRMGFGWGMLPDQQCLDDLADGRLVPAPHVAPDIPVAIRLFRPEADQGRTAEAFWTQVVKRAPETVLGNWR